MCGCYIVSRREKFLRILNANKVGVSNEDMGLLSGFTEFACEVFPGADVPVITQTLCPKIVRWGMTYEGKKAKVFNARSESASNSRFFSHCFSNGRCIVPAEAYYEWRKNTVNQKNIKTKCRIFRDDSKLLVFAGILSQTNGTDELAVLTRPASSEIEDIHSRMPVILDRKQAALWLGGDWRKVLSEHSFTGLSILTEI